MPDLKRRIAALNGRLVAIRRAVHAWPELGFTEHKTAALIDRELGAARIPHKRMCGTGVVALVRGRRPGKTVLVRADIDGLPVTEQNRVPYRSKRPGIMHA